MLWIMLVIDILLFFMLSTLKKILLLRNIIILEILKLLLNYEVLKLL